MNGDQLRTECGHPGWQRGVGGGLWGTVRQMAPRAGLEDKSMCSPLLCTTEEGPAGRSGVPGHCWEKRLKCGAQGSCWARGTHGHQQPVELAQHQANLLEGGPFLRLLSPAPLHQLPQLLQVTLQGQGGPGPRGRQAGRQRSHWQQQNLPGGGCGGVCRGPSPWGWAQVQLWQG